MAFTKNDKTIDLINLDLSVKTFEDEGADVDW